MECDGKRAGDTCAADGGFGTCVPECDAECLVCVAAGPPAPRASPAGGCDAGGGRVDGGAVALALVVALVLGRW